jgi:hypothetical protein
MEFAFIVALLILSHTLRFGFYKLRDEHFVESQCMNELQIIVKIMYKKPTFIMKSYDVCIEKITNYEKEIKLLWNISVFAYES